MQVSFNLPRLTPQPFGEQLYYAYLLQALIEVQPPGWKYVINTTGLRGKTAHETRLGAIDPSRRCSRRWLYYPNRLLGWLLQNADLPSAKFLFGNTDIVHTFNAQRLPKDTPGLVLTIQDLGSLRFVNGNETKEMAAEITSSLRALISIARAIITISEFSKKEIIDLLEVDEKRICVIPDGVDRDIFRPLAENETDACEPSSLGLNSPYIIVMSGAARRKNLARLIDAFAILKTKYKVPHQLAMVGGSTLNDEDKVAYEKNLHKNDIKLLGYLSPDQLLSMLRQAQLLVCPSTYEGFGLPPLEAMACGVPVAISNCASLPEVGGEAAVYFNALEVEDIAQAMYSVISDQELRERLVQDGLKRSLEFSWARNAHETIGLYQAVAKRLK